MLKRARSHFWAIGPSGTREANSVNSGDEVVLVNKASLRSLAALGGRGSRRAARTRLGRSLALPGVHLPMIPSQTDSTMAQLPATTISAMAGPTPLTNHPAVRLLRP